MDVWNHWIIMDATNALKGITGPFFTELFTSIKTQLVTAITTSLATLGLAVRKGKEARDTADDAKRAASLDKAIALRGRARWSLLPVLVLGLALLLFPASLQATPVPGPMEQVTGHALTYKATLNLAFIAFGLRSIWLWFRTVTKFIVA
jgi:hypothetical protein